ncbi:piwi-like protein 1 isoform X2 [Panonychus citri]|uniref:piwi-like protein 1 isoform X2 n=1 Tax=Panonychus citri TaxID=50023 RepID=UPI002307B679|nr:piwi-like protein 1 isoform X2 [Panonychus citri]
MEGRPRGRGSGGSSERSTSSRRSTSRPPRNFPAEAPIRTIPDGLVTKASEIGVPVRLYSNHFHLKTPKDVIIYDYHIDFEPIVEASRLRGKLVYQNREHFNNCYIFDGGSNVKSLHQIAETMTVTGVNHNNENIQITIKPTGRIAWGHPEMMRFYNTQMKRNLVHIGMSAIGRNFFDKSGSIFIPEHRVEVWPGMLTAINEHDEGILMVANVLNKIIRRETALDILVRIYRTDKNQFKEKSRRELAGVIVMTNYNSKTYRIDDVIFDKNPRTYTFERREFCLMTGITELMRNDMRFRKEVDRHVKLGPAERMKSLKDFAQRLTSHPKVNEEMSQWNLQLDPQLVHLTGRLLASEKILMSDRSDEDGILYDQRSGSFEQEIRTERMREPVDLEYWVIVAPSRDKCLITSYQDSLRRVAGPLGIRLSPPKYLWLDDDRTATYLDVCRRIPSDKVKLVHVVVPNNNRERYNTIKRYFCVDCPCPSQVLTRRVLDKNQLAVATKLVVQMSVKMGAKAWALVIPPKNVMIVGFNTYRDTSRRGHSVGAFVCSTNSETTTWYSRVDYHQNSDEMSSNFATNLKFGLKSWHAINGRFPEKIIIYRDGVSEGQIGHIFKTETVKIREILAERADLVNTHWCFIIVNKRVNARFFMQPANLTAPVVNPISGTIIDSVVTRAERYDFYLVSQSVRFGTVNPTMYNIIADDTGWKPIHHQSLAYKLCHLYYNWAGTISVPAPCHYAYKLAFLIGTCIHQEPSPSLANKLYFL